MGKDPLFSIGELSKGAEKVLSDVLVGCVRSGGRKELKGASASPSTSTASYVQSSAAVMPAAPVPDLNIAESLLRQQEYAHLGGWSPAAAGGYPIAADQAVHQPPPLHAPGSWQTQQTQQLRWAPPTVPAEAAQPQSAQEAVPEPAGTSEQEEWARVLLSQVDHFLGGQDDDEDADDIDDKTNLCATPLPQL